MSGTPPRVSEEAGREKRYCAVVPKSIRGSRQSEERGGLPSIYNRDRQGLHLPQDVGANRGTGWEKKV